MLAIVWCLLLNNSELLYLSVLAAGPGPHKTSIKSDRQKQGLHACSTVLVA